MKTQAVNETRFFLNDCAILFTEIDQVKYVDVSPLKGSDISVTFKSDGSVWVLVKNAANRAWNSNISGKYFVSLEAALDNYKSAKTKSLINTAKAALDRFSD